jgi:hypothetical protein
VILRNLVSRPLGFYGAVAAVYLMPMPFRALTHVIQTGGDACWQMWWLWWAKESVTRGQSPYFTDRLLHPTGASLYLSATDMITAMLSIPLQYLVGLVATYNILVFCSMVFSAWAMRRLALEVTGSTEGALVAGAVYSLAPLVSASVNMGHLIWVDLGFMPLAVLGLWRLEKGRPRALLARALPVSLAVLVSLYQGLFLLVFTLVYACHRGVVGILERDWEGLRQFSLRLVLWGALSAAFVAPVLLPTLREGLENTAAEVRRDWVAGASAGVLDPFVPNPLSPLFGGGRDSTRGQACAFGYVALVLATLGAVHARKQSLVWLLALGTFYLLSLGPAPRLGAHELDWPFLPYNLLYGLPFGKIPRTPVRFLFLANLCLAVLAAWGISAIARQTSRSSRPWTSWSVPFATGLLLIEYWPGPRPTDAMAVSPFYAMLARAEPGALLELPQNVTSRAMFWQTAHGHSMLGGYLARYPQEAGRKWSVPVIRQLWIGTPAALRDLGRTEILDQPPLASLVSPVLNAYGVRYVVLHLDRPGAPSLEIALRKAMPADALIWEDQELLAYRIPEDDARAGVVAGFGVGFRPPQQRHPDPRLERAAESESELGLILLDREARTVHLEALASGRRWIPIAIGLNAEHLTTLHLARVPRCLDLPLRLWPGYNQLTFRALGQAASLPSGEDVFYLGRVRLRGSAGGPAQPGALADEEPSC